jgi:putative Holliday junction resolvase
MMQAESVLCLDIGRKRIGIARAFWPDGLPTPLATIPNDEDFMFVLEKLIKQENAVLIVAGKPRTLDGRETEQTAYSMDIADQVRNETQLPVYLEDEAVTSVEAEAELKSRGEPYAKADIDALSAVYILNNFMAAHPKGAGIE